MGGDGFGGGVETEVERLGSNEAPQAVDQILVADLVGGEVDRHAVFGGRERLSSAVGDWPGRCQCGGTEHTPAIVMVSADHEHGDSGAGYQSIECPLVQQQRWRQAAAVCCLVR